MTFLYPLALFLTALLPAVILLYLRRPRREKREVSSLLFWQKVLERSARQKFLGKLRNPFSLLLALLILCLLILALAKPQWLRPGGLRSTVIVLDLRARMQAGDTFARALAATRALAREAGVQEQVAVLGAAGSPRLISPFSSDPRSLEDALRNLTPTDGGGSLDDTLKLARELIQSREEPRRIVVISDRTLPGPADTKSIATGKSTGNVALLALAPRRIPASPQSFEVLLKVGNFSSERRDPEIEFALDDKVFEIATPSLDAEEEQDVIIQLPSEALAQSEGRLTARLTGEDALSVDNIARAVIPAGQRKRVLLVTQESPFLESALRADRSLSLEILEPHHWKPELASGFDAVVWDAAWPAGSSLPPGHFFFAGGSPFESEQAVPADRIQVTQPDHPLLRNSQLANLPWTEGRKLTLPTSPDWHFQTLLESTGEPLLVTAESPAGQKIVASALPLSDPILSTRADFPLLIANILDWLTASEDTTFTLRAGETYLPRQIRLDKNGFHDGNRVAVNTASREESDLRPGESTGTAEIVRGVLPAFRLWQWLGLAALALLLAEWATYHRRLTE